MATVTLTATNYSITNVATVTDASNAYTDTTSSTYAQVTTTSSSASKAYFYGFDFSQIPNGATITSVTYKIKVKTVGSGGSTFYVFLENRNTSTELSAKTSTASTTSETVVTLTPTSATWSDIVAMGDNFAFCVQHSRTTRTQNVYGMEIDVTYTMPYVPNKVIYGNETLIDLTGDTVTAADVASGVTFHLPSGLQATGAATGGLTIVGGEGYPDSSSQFTIPNVPREPVFLWIYTTSTSNMDTNYNLQYVVYCEGAFSKWQKYGHNDQVNDFDGTFAYSNNTLTITTSWAFKYDTSWPCKYYYYYGY